METRPGLGLVLTLALSLGVALPGGVRATETENIGVRILPAPGKVIVDGKIADWDLSGGIFCCGDVENQRTQFATWLFAMYDAENLYLLARFVDPTPLNNPGQVEGDYGFAGDCLQFRTIVGVGAAGNADQGRGAHWTCWRGRDGKHVMDVAYGVRFDKPGSMKDAQTKGAKQAFRVWDDKQGYDQEIAIPWALLGPEGWKPKAGDDIRFTLEPNFTVGSGGRLSNKDIFLPDVGVDRVFTFMACNCWGVAHFEKAGQVEPAPVRLSDRREFKVTLEKGEPKVDWTGLIRQKELLGHKALAFEMPFDGYISLNIFDANGAVARQLLNSAFYTKGKHEVKWDGLSTFSWRNPGEPVPAGTYTWQALVNPGLDLKLVGWAANAGAAPWDGPSGKDNWGGDEGQPCSAAAGGDKVLLGWNGAEAGKALVACDLDGKVQWKNSRQGMAGCLQVATDGKYVYGVNWGANGQSYAYRLELANGSYAAWPGKDTPDLTVHSLLNDEQKKTIPDCIDAIAVRDGQLYLANTKGDLVLVCDGQTGALKNSIKIPAPVALAAAAGNQIYVSSTHDAARPSPSPRRRTSGAWPPTLRATSTPPCAARPSRSRSLTRPARRCTPSAARAAGRRWGSGTRAASAIRRASPSTAKASSGSPRRACALSVSAPGTPRPAPSRRSSLAPPATARSAATSARPIRW